MIEFFSRDSQIVAQQIMLINEGMLKEENVPDVFNLREVVGEILAESKGGEEENLKRSDSDDSGD